jgi:predicted DNA-binding protein YlxM (UPF0122 family)
MSEINKALKEGLDKDAHFEETPAYEMLMRKFHELETVTAPQMKSMAALYTKSKDKFLTKASGDAPAIIGGDAIVQIVKGESDKDENLGKYVKIPVTELLTNASKYKLLTNQDILTKRADNADFSGYTEIGRLSDQIIDAAYGSVSYNKDIDASLDNIGYKREKGKYKRITDNSELSLNQEFEPTSQLVTSKSNVGNILTIFDELSQGDTNLTNYVKNKAIADLHNNISRGKIVLDDKENTIDILMKKSIATQLITKLKSKIQDDRVADDKTNGTSASDKDKDRKGNIITDAMVSLLQNRQRVEISNIKETSDPSVGSLMNSIPAAAIYDSSKWLATGYGENNKTEGDKDVSDSNRRTLANNTIINSMTGGNETLMTTYGGVPFEGDGNSDDPNFRGIADNGDLNNVILSPKENLHIVLAPTVVDDRGKVKVDFTNDFTPKMLQAIKETYEELKTKGITQTDVAKMGEEGIKQLQDIAKEKLAKLLGPGVDNPPVIRAAFSFNVQYEADDNSYDNPDYGWNANADYIHSIVNHEKGLPWRTYTKETVAFIPISDSFWRASQKQGSLPSTFENSISAPDYEGVTKSSPVIGDFNNEMMALFVSQKAYDKKNAKKKKFGGKLYSTEELRNLLYN